MSEPRLQLAGGSCNLASIETPELGEMLSKLGVAPSDMDAVRAAAEADAPRPQMLSFVRHPVSRCRSHWNYEQALCRRSNLGVHAPFCTGYFLPNYGAPAKLHDVAAHTAFASEHCTEIVTRSLTAAHGVPSPLAVPS